MSDQGLNWHGHHSVICKLGRVVFTGWARMIDVATSPQPGCGAEKPEGRERDGLSCHGTIKVTWRGRGIAVVPPGVRAACRSTCCSGKCGRRSVIYLDASVPRHASLETNLRRSGAWTSDDGPAPPGCSSCGGTWRAEGSRGYARTTEDVTLLSRTADLQGGTVRRLRTRRSAVDSRLAADRPVDRSTRGADIEPVPRGAPPAAALPAISRTRCPARGFRAWSPEARLRHHPAARPRPVRLA